MKHKYKVIRFVNNEQVCEWKEEEIDPILCLNDFYNFIDKKQFDDAWGHGQGSKDEIYNVLKKHLEALEIIKKYIRVDKPFDSACYIYLNDESEMIPEEQFDLLKEVLL